MILTPLNYSAGANGEDGLQFQPAKKIVLSLDGDDGQGGKQWQSGHAGAAAAASSGVCLLCVSLPPPAPLTHTRSLSVSGFLCLSPCFCPSLSLSL